MATQVLDHGGNAPEWEAVRIVVSTVPKLVAVAGFGHIYTYDANSENPTWIRREGPGARWWTTDSLVGQR